MPVLRTVKNIVKNHTDAEVKVREATSNDPWGPSSTLMAEVADLTYNVVAFTEIMGMIWKRLSDHGKNWRHVYKSLVVLEYIIKTGSEKVAQQCKENIFAIQTLRDFQHIEDNKDLGTNVREKAKILVALLKDDERLKNERAKALKAKERFAENFGIGSDQSQTQLGKPRHRTDHQHASAHSSSSATANSELEEARPHSAGEEELQLQLALAMSKEEADTDAKKRTNDELKLQLALEESKKEDEVTEQRRRQQNSTSLLDFAGGPSASNDPWATSTAAQPEAVSNDPWSSTQPPAPAVAVNTASPFSPLPSSASNDPWAAGSNGATTGPTPVSANPWDAPPPAVTATATTDPWLSSSNPPNGNTHKPVSTGLDDDFESLGLRPSPASQPNPPAPMQGDMMFSAGLMSSDMTSSQPGIGGPKKAEDFLDPKAKDLVNLDSLVTKPKSPGGVVNPFAMTSHGTGSTAVGDTNPFLAQQPVRPSLNQMTTSNSLQGFSSGPTQPPLMNPMMPTGQVPIMYPGYPPQQPAQSNNPFL